MYSLKYFVTNSMLAEAFIATLAQVHQAKCIPSKIYSCLHASDKLGYFIITKVNFKDLGNFATYCMRHVIYIVRSIAFETEYFTGTKTVA